MFPAELCITYTGSLGFSQLPPGHSELVLVIAFCFQVDPSPFLLKITLPSFLDLAFGGKKGKSGQFLSPSLFPLCPLLAPHTFPPLSQGAFSRSDQVLGPLGV